MTVADMIEKLKRMPQDVEVTLYCDGVYNVGLVYYDKEEDYDTNVVVIEGEIE